PPDRLAEVLPRLLRRVGDVDDLVHRDVAARVRSVRVAPRRAVGVEVLPEEVPRGERGRGEDLEAPPRGERVRVGGDRRGPEGRVRLLEGPRQDVEVAHLEELALERHALVGPGAPDHLDGLVEALTRLLHRDAEAPELLGLVAAADAELEAPAR